MVSYQIGELIAYMIPLKKSNNLTYFQRIIVIYNVAQSYTYIYM